ncbi:MAG: tetratricopeptide repeat protein [Gammaproteobacteria bacterium]|nr:tetratricopeptide repeat protein [Gammaproteobacteria bacterium]
MSSDQNQLNLSVSQFFQDAVSHHQRGELQHAEIMYRQLLNQQPENPDVLHLLGVVESQLGRHDSAVEFIQRAITIRPDMPDFYNDLALVYISQGNFNAAINSCKQVLQMYPDHAGAHFILGNANFQLGKYEAAAAAYDKALVLNPDDPDVIFNLGNALRELGKLEEAVAAFEKSLHLRPDYAMAHNNLGSVFRKLEKLEQAEACFRQAIFYSPDFAGAYTNLGLVMTQLGKFEEAKFIFEKTLQFNPDHAETHNHLGIVLYKLFLLDEARMFFERAIELNPKYAEAYCHLGEVLMLQQQLEAAQFCMEKALKLKPDLSIAYYGMGNIYLHNGYIKKAQEAYEKALKLDPNLTDAKKGLIRTRKYTKSDQEEIISITSQLNNPQLENESAAVLHLALGKILDDCGDYEKAFYHYDKANTLKRKTVNFDSETHRQFVNQLILVFNKDLYENRIIAGDTSRQPVFIVGMPRSGTSLVEQIIASHPSAFGAGELDYFSKIAVSLPELLKTNADYPACITHLDQLTAQSIITDYLELLLSYSSRAQRITDKMPSNFLHLGLIAILFPSASIIHCRRNELDTCLSIYFQFFAGHHPYTYNLDEIGAYYYQYKKLMGHWRDVLSIKMYEIDYEMLISNQEEESRKLIEYIGMPWEKRCLSFHKTKRPVMTASNWQVRQPIYTSSVERWRNYEPYLDSLKRILKTG